MDCMFVTSQWLHFLAKMQSSSMPSFILKSCVAGPHSFGKIQNSFGKTQNILQRWQWQKQNAAPGCIFPWSVCTCICIYKLVHFYVSPCFTNWCAFLLMPNHNLNYIITFHGVLIIKLERFIISFFCHAFEKYML